MKLSEDRCRILFFTVHAAFFVSHRLNLAVEAQRKGADVYVIYGLPASKEMTDSALEALNRAGIKHKELSFSSRSLSLINIVRACMLLASEIKKFKPNIVHSISSMPVLLMLASSINLKNILRVSAISGFGTIKNGWYFSMYKRIVRLLSRNTDVFIFQNIEDQHLFSDFNVKMELIPGSGVNKAYLDLTAKRMNVLFAARLMRAKGVERFCKVAKAVRNIDPTITFTLAGASDYDHPDAISLQELKGFDGFDKVEYLGFQADISDLFKRASVIFYPSRYAEGLSKTLLEGAMAGCVIVTYDRAGCREAVLPDVSGIILPMTTSVIDEKDILINLFSDNFRTKLNDMMKKANVHAVNNFSIEAVTSRHMEIYRI